MCVCVCVCVCVWGGGGVGGAVGEGHIIFFLAPETNEMKKNIQGKL